MLCAAIVLLTVLPKLVEATDLSRMEKSQIGNSEVEIYLIAVSVNFSWRVFFFPFSFILFSLPFFPLPPPPPPPLSRC